MKRLILATVGTLLGAMQAHAANINLFEYGLNVNGTTYGLGDPLPANINLAGFDLGTGLGTISITLSGAGPHSVIAFFDHDIDEAENTFFNEFGNAVGMPAAGQSWEIDEPGFGFGDIFDNFLAGALDNTNAVPAAAPDDVSMAMGWDFTLTAGQTALLRFFVADAMRSSPLFYLVHTDPDSQANVYLYSTLDIRGGQVPEPGSLLLLGLGLFGLVAARRYRASQH